MTGPGGWGPGWGPAMAHVLGWTAVAPPPCGLRRVSGPLLGEGEHSPTSRLPTRTQLVPRSG